MEELLTLLQFSPKQAKIAYNIWKPVYNEYAKINYRIDKAVLEEIQKL